MVTEEQKRAQLVEWVYEAGRLALSFRTALGVQSKADGSLVTAADRAVEAYLRPLLLQLQPGVVWGEEQGFAGDADEPLWLIDPIDGTSNFAFGQPLWGVSVGLRMGGKLVLGAVYLPELDEMYAAHLGGGATCNGGPVPMLSSAPTESTDLIGYGDVDTFNAFRQIYPGKMRHNGAFVIEAMFVASGRLRAMTSSRACLYDAAGSFVILTELGCQYWTLDGQPFDPATSPVPGLMPPLIASAPGVFDLSRLGEILPNLSGA
jgi:myo-inositol-1(or 4)-monophosphatase